MTATDCRHPVVTEPGALMETAPLIVSYGGVNYSAELDDYDVGCPICGSDEEPCPEHAGGDHDDDTDTRTGTSSCPGLCDPMCDWCLVAHECPDACEGGVECPYARLSAAHRSDP